MLTFFKKIKSPVGELTLIGSEKNLLAILWENDSPDRVHLQKCEAYENHPVLLETNKQLDEYFNKKRTRFNLPLEFKGTPFQIKVWEKLQTIPFGETRTYKDLANDIGHPKAYRAVGAANRCNPISIIVPCHRVIGTNGKLTGFAGGLPIKKLLLEIEEP